MEKLAFGDHRGERAVTGLVYTHSHVDHFGGAEGVIEPGNPDDVPILAPAGFLDHAVSANVYAGTAMGRRGVYHTGVMLEKGPDAMIGTGLGQTASSGRISLVPPNRDITRTGQEEVLDGVRIVFQMTPGTEAPTAPMSPSPLTTGRRGAATPSWRSCPSSGTCTPTCTTRRCGCSTRASPASRSPR